MEEKNAFNKKIPPQNIDIRILSPVNNEPVSITEDDVWGKWNKDRTKRLDSGMIKVSSGEKCPYFNDILKYKDVTVVCKKEKFHEVVYWLEYVHGSGCIKKKKDIDCKNVAVRSSYMAW